MLGVASLRCGIEKGGQPGGGEHSHAYRRNCPTQLKAVSKEVWSLADTAVEMQIQWGKQYSQQQHFLLFQEGGGVFWRWNKLHLQKPITILSALESFLSAHQPMGKLSENLAQEKGWYEGGHLKSVQLKILVFLKEKIKTQSIYVKERKDNEAIRSKNINKCEKKAEKDKLKFPLLFHLSLISPFFKI